MEKTSINTFCMEVCENTFDEITILSTLISSIQELCLNLEMNSQ